MNDLFKGVFFSSSKTDIVRHMHEIICDLNDETYYLDMWIQLVPDGACEEDFEDIAETEDLFDEVVAMFFEIMKQVIEDAENS